MVLGDWYWYAFGDGVLEDFQSEKVNPGSYDVTMDDTIMLQVFRGREYPNTKAKLDDSGYMRFTCPYTGERQTVFSDFDRGDCFLASTMEYFYVPRFISLQYLDKSSTGREGISHRHAGYIDAGFRGTLTLEFDVHRSGRLMPYLPIGQVVASLTWSLYPYSKRKTSRYVGQEGVTGSRNKQLAFKASVDEMIK